MAVVQKRWTFSESRELESMRGENVFFLAKRFGRSIHSIKAKLERKQRMALARAYAYDTHTRLSLEPIEAPPPAYVLRERSIRRQLNPDSNTAKICGDPLPGYTAGDTKARHISVQDALEMRALYSGRAGEIIALATAYKISPPTVSTIIDGEWFERLLPRRKGFREMEAI